VCKQVKITRSQVRTEAGWGGGEKRSRQSKQVVRVCSRF
jgi:hypothetical protein